MKISQQPQIIPTRVGILPINQKDLSKFLSKTKIQDEIKIVYFGTPIFSAYILGQLVKFCLNSPQNLSVHPKGVHTNLPKFVIQTVITNPDKPVGRSMTSISTPVAQVAQKYNILVLKPEKLDEQFLTSHFSLLTADLFIVVSFGQILPQSLLDIPKLGSLNLHGSLLPKYRGASPIQQAILNGDKETGVTLTLMDEQLDHGPILSTKVISISKQDAYETLSNKMMQLGARLLIEALPKFVEGKLTPKQQNHTSVTYCERLTKQSGYFPIDKPPPTDRLGRMIRAYYPWPGVWTKWKGKIVKFLPSPRHPELDSGSTQFLLQMEGKKAISFKDFLNGYPDFPLKISLDRLSLP